MANLATSLPIAADVLIAEQIVCFTHGITSECWDEVTEFVLPLVRASHSRDVTPRAVALRSPARACAAEDDDDAHRTPHRFWSGARLNDLASAAARVAEPIPFAAVAFRSVGGRSSLDPSVTPVPPSSGRDGRERVVGAVGLPIRVARVGLIAGVGVMARVRLAVCIGRGRGVRERARVGAGAGVGTAESPPSLPPGPASTPELTH